ncbi:15223_t:CDS:2, partial [Racocetra persica]
VVNSNSSYQTNTILAIVGFLLIRITFYAKSGLNRVGMLAYLVSEIDSVGSISYKNFVNGYGINGATNNTTSRDTNGFDQGNTNIDSTGSTSFEIEAYLDDDDDKDKKFCFKELGPSKKCEDLWKFWKARKNSIEIVIEIETGNNKFNIINPDNDPEKLNAKSLKDFRIIGSLILKDN